MLGLQLHVTGSSAECEFLMLILASTETIGGGWRQTLSSHHKHTERIRGRKNKAGRKLFLLLPLANTVIRLEHFFILVAMYENGPVVYY